nr:phosphoglycerate mutase [Hymenolepis microstoma]
MLGALQGMSQVQSFCKFGECQVKLWTNSFDIPPPDPISTDPKPFEFDSRYAHLDTNLLPKTESMKDTVERVLPFWHDEIVPSIKKGKRVLVVAHLNSIRALLKHIDNIPNEKIMDIDIPTGIPLVYELQANLAPVRKYYLAETSELAPVISREIGNIKLA